MMAASGVDYHWSERAECSMYNARHYDAASHLAAEVGNEHYYLIWYVPASKSDDGRLMHTPLFIASDSRFMSQPSYFLPRATGQSLRLVIELLQLHRVLRVCSLHLPHLRFGDRPGWRAKWGLQRAVTTRTTDCKYIIFASNDQTKKKVALALLVVLAVPSPSSALPSQLSNP